jgi:hypothetical protein
MNKIDAEPKTNWNQMQNWRRGDPIHLTLTGRCLGGQCKVHEAGYNKNEATSGENEDEATA